MTERRKRKREEVDSAIDDEEEAELLAAAAAWAGQVEPSASTPGLPLSSIQPRKLSLHITQIPFECTELDIRSHFAAKGCAVRSVRMVYDEIGGKGKQFRGVAFCDVADEQSYELALKVIHRSRLLGRKINVRPTRTREELSNIVERTKEIVTERKKLALAAMNSGERMPEELTASAKKKRKEKDKKSTKSDDKNTSSMNGGEKKAPSTKLDDTKGDGRKNPSGKSGEKKNLQFNKSEKTMSLSKSVGNKGKSKQNDTEKTTQKKRRESKEGKEKPKLTKQQRNRRAAILTQHRNKK
jgi:RNA recognition motif-containing protein